MHVVHHLYEENKLLNILMNAKAGNPDSVYVYINLKNLLAGAGVAAMAASRGNMEYIKATGCANNRPNKINQLLHVRFSDLTHKGHMKKCELKT